jgi:polyhydroxyalkanoate synthesis repressor PhaR
MAAKSDPVTIKKYANRRLYNTGTSSYVTLDDLAEMVKKKEDFVVQDAKTGEDITHAVLTQIIFELEGKEGQNMLPISFLRQLISFYGDQMQMVVPSYLEQSMALFAKEQERIREQMSSIFGGAAIGTFEQPMKAIEEQTRRNMEMFQKAMSVFTPFGAPGRSEASGETERTAKPASDDLAELREQISEMQRKLDSFSKR